MKQIPKEHLRTCTYCYFRHSCSRPFKFDKNGKIYCNHWRLGRCLLCKYVNTSEDEWFKRGCETWCFSGRRKCFKRDWKATLKWWFKRIVEEY